MKEYFKRVFGVERRGEIPHPIVYRVGDWENGQVTKTLVGSSPTIYSKNLEEAFEIGCLLMNVKKEEYEYYTFSTGFNTRLDGNSDFYVQGMGSPAIGTGISIRKRKSDTIAELRGKITRRNKEIKALRKALKNK